MRYVNLLGLAIAAAVWAITIGAGTAGAAEFTCTGPPGTRVTCPTGTTTNETSTHVVFHPPIGDITCTHAVHNMSTTSMSSASGTGSATGCNGTVDILKSGSETVDATSGGNGTVTSTGFEVTIEFVGFHCIFSTNGTQMGTLTGSSTTGGEARVDLGGTIPRTGGRSGAFCGSSAGITGTFTVTTPAWFEVDP